MKDSVFAGDPLRVFCNNTILCFSELVLWGSIGPCAVSMELLIPSCMEYVPLKMSIPTSTVFTGITMEIFSLGHGELSVLEENQPNWTAFYMFSPFTSPT